MIVGVPRESLTNEKRTAVSPTSIAKIQKLGFECHVESGCGVAAKFSDKVYEDAGAKVVSADEVWSADIIFKVQPPNADEVEKLESGMTLVGFIWPAKNESLLKTLAEKNVTVLAMDCVPRISRAQKLDALSSMANIAGYRAVIEAANVFGGVFTGQITAAGKMPPAKVLVIGAGVAGLAAIGAAKGLGAIVRAFDTRLAVKEQVESMGADFLELEFEESGEGEGGYAKVMSDEFIEKEMELFAQQAKEVDIIITTALIPGKPAPRLLDAALVESMKDGSVIVDMAAEQGGNCELTEPGKLVEKHGVSLIGYFDLPSRLSTQATKLYGNNLTHLLDELAPDKDGTINVDTENNVIRGCLVTHNGEVTWPPPKIEDPSPPQKEVKTPVVAAAEPAEKSNKALWTWGSVIAAVAVMLLVGFFVDDPSFLSHFTVFVLSCFIGWQVVWNVTPALHTPLMSVTNAVSGIIIVGALLQIQPDSTVTIGVLSGLAILIATINIAGGFLVTHRMLGMFRKDV